MAVVVVAEDDDDLRAIAVRLLSRGGHRVTAAPNGAEALRLVGEERPDVVVSDIDMPVMSGVDLCLAIRADPALRELPVVFISGSLVPGDDRPVRAQATTMLRKPFTAQELLGCVEKALHSGHQPGQEPFDCP
ncbi:response regulator [Couchioplanes azureus]|uniref:response regulator n=1 Tax=Couchioplanes caeruleus TaxID=56438 RepID=UPI0016709C86|nr:response regulator [Couchioplanes caeruleus]GGQ44837.1 response regulator [Couchioplanes caeruleus subsp. azureus]